MINFIKTWYLKNYIQISWFVVGWLTLSGLIAISTGNYISALISFGLAWLNAVASR